MIPKIQTAEEKEKKEKRTRTIMAIFVVVLLGASTAGYALMETNSSETKKYNGFSFSRADNGGWTVKKLNIVTSYLPQDVENISIDAINANDFSGNAYIVAFGTEEVTGANELLKVLNIEKVTRACSQELENESFCSEFPIKSCSDAAQSSPVIIFEQSNETAVSYNSYCLTIKSEGADFVKAADRAVFVIAGIMKA